MAPKKEKENVIMPDEWQTIIEEAPLDEETWKVKVILIESAGGEQERIYLNNFERSAAEEKRFVIKNICKTETFFMINQLGSEKKVKDPNLKVFDECQSYLADKKNIPADVLALVIKHLILKMKDEYLFIRQQRLEVRLGLQRESATMIDKTEVIGTIASATTEAPPPPPPLKVKGKGGGEPTGVPESSGAKKFNTQLRVRGEEWRDKVYVDDYPTDGPNLYVAVTGFEEPHLPGSLVKIGIPLSAVVQIRIDPTKTKVPSSLLKATKRGQSLTDFLAEKSMKFWDDIQLLRIHKDSADHFKDTAFIVFSPPYRSADDFSASPDKIYDDLCFLMYDIQDLTRQHLHYMENMSIIDVPEDVSNKCFITDYKQNIDDLPLECVTIYTVLDSILQTACIGEQTEVADDETKGTSLSSTITLASLDKNKIEETKLEKSENLIKQIFNTLDRTKADKKKYRLTYGQEYEENKDPIVLNYGDFAKYNTFQLGNINLDKTVFSSLFGMPINNLWRSKPRPSEKLESKINFHVNVLLSCFERNDVETAELNRLINILACRKLYNNRSSLKKPHLPPSTISEFKKKYLKRSALSEPLPKCSSLVGTLTSSFPSMTKSEDEYECSLSQSDIDSEVQRLKAVFECPDISELVTAAEIENNQPLKHNMIDDFDYFEDLSGNCAFQILREAFNKFNCVDYKYCEVTDCFILMFYNSHDNEGIAREEWRSHLTTELCLQDFFDFILDDQYEWIQNEEKIYDDNLSIAAESVTKDVFDPHALKSCLETTDVEMDLLMEGSLKYEVHVQVEEDATEVTGYTESFTTKSSLSTDTHSKAAISKTVPARKLKKNISYVEDKEYESICFPAKPFLGYDLGDRRVEVFGKNAIFFSRDGTKVTSMYSLTIPLNLEYIILNILPGNSCNEFWVHKALGDHVKQEIKDTCESFRIISKDQVLIYIKKQIYKVSLQSVLSTEIVEKANSSKVIKDGSKIEETKYFHSLYVSWPNGMITETVYEDNSPVISHIKQYYTHRMPHLDEEMRCISLNGEVVIFKPSDVIEVLKPDGTCIKINKYYKQVVPVTSSEPEELPGEANKSKKSKTKGAFKMAAPVEDIADLPPLEYEVVVNDFEITESDGRRQKWIENVPFDLEKLLIITTDYCTGEVVFKRMDGTNTLINKDGLHCVTFPDKTRIVTSYQVDDVEIYPEWTDVELEYLEMFEPDIIVSPRLKGSVSQSSNVSCPTSESLKMEEEEIKEKERTDGYIFIHILYTIEHPNFSTVSINNVNGTISVESPNGSTVIVDKSNKYEINLDSETSANFDGENLYISYEACSECRAFTNCDITVMTNEERSINNTKDDQIWLKMTDSFNTHVFVNQEGSIGISDDLSSLVVKEKDPGVKSESSHVSQGKCVHGNIEKNIRFFILRRDLNCAELLHRACVEEYKRACRWQPWCSINQYDTFGDHRNLVSILTPVHLTEPEKWLMESKQASKPKFKRHMSLLELKEGPKPAKGFYHWMRPYERFVPQPQKPDNVIPDRLPRAYILRILEQEWNEEKRKELMGARELIQAVLRYRCIMEADSETVLNVPIIDMKSKDERGVDDIIQALAQKIYEDLKVRLANDIKSRAKLTITTRPPVVPKGERVSTEEENVEEEMYEAKSFTKSAGSSRESLVKDAEAAEKIDLALKRYWCRRAEEYKEELFYKYILREGSVPPYFRNVLGGAIWWDVNNATAEAVTLAERRKMKCLCTDNEASTFSKSSHATN